MIKTNTTIETLKDNEVLGVHGGVDCVCLDRDGHRCGGTSFSHASLAYDQNHCWSTCCTGGRAVAYSLDGSYSRC